MASLDPRVIIEDARMRQAAVVALIGAIDSQAMRLMRLYVTLGVASAAAGIGTLFAKEPALPAALGWALLGGTASLGAGMWLCFRVMKPGPISLPGRRPDFWLWAMRDDVASDDVLRAYLQNLSEKIAQNDRVNKAMASQMKWAKLAGLLAPAIAIVIGVATSVWSGAV